MELIWNNDFLKFMLFFGTGAEYSCGGRVNVGMNRTKINFLNENFIDLFSLMCPILFVSTIIVTACKHKSIAS